MFKIDPLKEQICQMCTHLIGQTITVALEDLQRHAAVVHGQDFLTVEEIREACAFGAVGNQVAPDSKPDFQV